MTQPRITGPEDLRIPRVSRPSPRLPLATITDGSSTDSTSGACSCKRGVVSADSMGWSSAKDTRLIAMDLYVLFNKPSKAGRASLVAIIFHTAEL